MTLEERLTRIETMLAAMFQSQQKREWYSVEEFARLVGRSGFTCRQWCRLGRIAAQKKSSGRGAHATWAIPHTEFERFQREGLRPAKKDGTRPEREKTDPFGEPNA